MLPPGHIAGGFLAAKVAAIWIPQLNQAMYLGLSSLFAFAPDLDFFYVFVKSKKLLADNSINHHKFLSHAPLVYAAVFLLWFWLFPTSRLVAITFILGTWSHFFLDSLEGDGIPWFYRFNHRLYSFFKVSEFDLHEQRFFRHWWSFTRQYLRLFISKIEILIIIIAIIIYFN